MIRIVTEKVKMPDLNKRRFQKNPKDCNGYKWVVSDTMQNRNVYEGGFEMVSIVCHNMNKNFYKHFPHESNKLTTK